MPSLFESDVAAAPEWMKTPVRGLGLKSPLEHEGGDETHFRSYRPIFCQMTPLIAMQNNLDILNVGCAKKGPP